MQNAKVLCTLGEVNNEDFLLVDFFEECPLVSSEASLSPEVERMLEFLRLSTLEVLVLGFCLLEDEEDRPGPSLEDLETLLLPTFLPVDLELPVVF